MPGNDTLVIKIEPADGGIPIEMFADYLIAHQDVLRVVVKAEDPNAPEPTLRVVDVEHGSMSIKATVDAIHQQFPFMQPVFTLMGGYLEEKLTGTQTIETTQSRSVKIPKKVLEKMSQPMRDGIIKNVTAFEEGKENSPIYNISAKDVKQNLEPDDPPAEPITPAKTELGETQQLTGHLKELDWDNKKAKFLTQIDGKPRKIQCVLFDEDFLKEKVCGDLHVQFTAVPEYKIGTLGEKTIHCFQVSQVEILE